MSTESSPASRAVFLSYASQDAEAVLRLADALRAAGVEVWFDQNELVGGDAWDAKIRGQIASCALFVPVISAATQGRLEGYFRIEWKLAAQRTHAMAEEKAFLLPVVIDATRDAEAKVPAEFRAVQWTRLPGGETPEKFCARVKKLLGGVQVESPALGTTSHRPDSPDQTKRDRGKWLTITGAFLVGFVGLSYFGWRALKSPVTSVAPARAQATELLGRVWEQLNNPSMGRASLALAGELCQRATTLDPDNADAWAAWSQVDTWHIYHALDSSSNRRAQASAKAARALRSAPQSFEARLAQACYLVRAVRPLSSAIAADAENTLRHLLDERAEEPRVLFALGILLQPTGRRDEATALFDRMARHSTFAAQALAEKGWLYYLAPQPRFSDAFEACDRSIAQQPFWGNLTLKALLSKYWLGDLAAAAAAAEQLPAEVFSEDFTPYIAWHTHWWRRDSAAMLRAVAAHPRDWVECSPYFGPKALLTGIAHALAGNNAAAEAAWRTGLKQVEQRLETQADDATLLMVKAQLQARLGATAEAAKTFDLARQFSSNAFRVERQAVIFGRDANAAIAHLEQGVAAGGLEYTAAALRLDPDLDWLRGDARFVALLARAAADSRLAPPANKGETRSAAAAPLAVDPKSVVVLPFANLSGDPAQEYFSDGLTEEILNALARERDLRVVPRASAFSFKGKNVPLPEIARALNVAQVVEGSVLRAGNLVRIRCTLTRVADGFAEALPPYEREMKDARDIFALHDAIAAAVLQKLTGRSAGGASPVLTKNVAAFEAFLRGREFLAQTSPSWPKAVEAFQRAVQLDPEFALAWANLGRALVQLHASGLKPGARTAGEQAITEALRLQPDLPEGHLAHAIALSADGTHIATALRELDQADKTRPDNSEIIAARSALAMHQGQRQQAIALARRAVELDPRNGVNVNQLGNYLRLDGAYAEAEKVYRAAFELLGTSIPLTNLALTRLYSEGDRRGVVGILDDVPAELRLVNYWRVRQALLYTLGDIPGSLAARPHVESPGEPYLRGALFGARAHEERGEVADAEREYRSALLLAERACAEFPQSPLPLAQKALACAGLGRKEEALAAARKSLELVPPNENPFIAAGGLGYAPLGGNCSLAQVQARFGMTAEALAIVKTHADAGWWRRNYLLLSPDWSLLRKDPRFRAIAEKAPL